MYRANPNLVVLPRLLNDKHKNAGFTVLNPLNRRRFALPVEREMPRLMQLLIECSKNALDDKELMRQGLIGDIPELKSLLDSGLIVSNREKNEVGFLAPVSYTSLYQKTIFNYPFGDYAFSATKIREDILMNSYADSAPPPPSYFKREGRRYFLPSIHFGGHSSSTFFEKLSNVLHYTFGAFGTLKWPHGEFFHKTSPSGGARHPCEAVVAWQGSGELPAGLYSYDFIEHALVDSEPADLNNRLSELLKGYPVAIFVRLRVERPMWRYRDPRSYRPILIDVGHIIETISLLSQDLNIEEKIIAPYFLFDNEGEWIEEPYIAAVFLGELQEESIFSATPDNMTVSNNMFITNQASYFSIENGEILAHTLHPTLYKTKITEDEFITLLNALEPVQLPSNQSYRNLIDCNALLESVEGLILNNGYAFWERHDWDMSLNAYLEASKYAVEYMPHIPNDGLKQVIPEGELIDVLLRRQTDRALKAEGVSKTLLSNLISVSLSSYLGNHDNIAIFIAVFNVEGLPSGLYEWKDGHYNILREDVPAEIFRDIAIGQKWSVRGAATVILALNLDVKNSQKYHSDIIYLGQLGQRVCIASAALNMGTFMTPAIKDMPLIDVLGLNGDNMDWAFYMIDIGAPSVLLDPKGLRAVASYKSNQ